jgi:hypothetical protein
MRQMPQQSSATSQVHFATACSFFTSTRSPVPADTSPELTLAASIQDGVRVGSCSTLNDLDQRSQAQCTLGEG